MLHLLHLYDIMDYKTETRGKTLKSDTCVKIQTFVLRGENT